MNATFLKLQQLHSGGGKKRIKENMMMYLVFFDTGK
jgi:hypothetical protein